MLQACVGVAHAQGLDAYDTTYVEDDSSIVTKPSALKSQWPDLMGIDCRVICLSAAHPSWLTPKL